MSDAKQAAALQATVTSPPKAADGGSNPYYRVVEKTDAMLQDYEMHPGNVPKAPWGAPTPGQEEVSRSLSNPLLQSSAAVEARQASRSSSAHSKAGKSDSALMIRPGSAAAPRPGRTGGVSTRRPATAAGARGSTHVPSPPPAASVQPEEGETFTANQIRKLEAEVEHLKTTIDVLVGSHGGVGKGGRGATLLRPSGLRTSAGTLTSPSKVRGPEERAEAGYAVHEANRTRLASTIADKKEHDARLLAMQKEIHHLSEPAVHEEMNRSAYTRVHADGGLRPTTPTSKPVVLPRALEPSPDPHRRASVPGRRASVGEDGAQRASAAGQMADFREGDKVRARAAGGGPPGSDVKAAVRARRHSALKASAYEGKEEEEGGRTHGSASASSTSASGTASSPAARARPRTAGVAGGSSAPPPRPSSAGPAVSTHTLSKAELEAAYSGLPGLQKTVAAGTKTEAFASMMRKKDHISIREAKFNVWMEEKRKDEDAALHFQFKAAPIAPATRDLDLYRRIMEKLAKRREEEHAKRSAQLESTLKPFEVVTKHCDDHAARLAANRARFLLNEQKELAEGRRFRANPVPNLSDPDGMFARLVQREQEREGRVSAMAREFYATAALPQRMALAVETEKRRRTEREARTRAQEEAEKRAATFHPVPLPDFPKLHEEFEDTLVASKVAAVSRMGGLTTPQVFGFDQPHRLHADAVRKETWGREASLQTSVSMALRKSSRAYGEGEDLVPGGNPNATARPGSAGAALDATGSRRMSGTGRPPTASARVQTIAEKLSVSNAPPAAMTRSVQLKMLSAQAQLRQAQEKELAAEEEGEAYARFIKESTRKFAPVFQEMERARVPKPLIWQMDKVAAATSEARVAFEKVSRERAEVNRRRISLSQQNRPLVMMQYAAVERGETAKRDALQAVAAAAARGGQAGTWRSVVERGVGGTQLFTEAEKAVLADA